MKKKKLLIALPLFVMMALTACDNPATSSTSSSSSSSTSLSSSSQSESISDSSSKTSVTTVTHQDAFISANDGAVTRKFNENYDKLITDFSGETEGNIKNHLRVLVDNLCEGAPVSEDASIYKMATGSYEIHNYDGIGFRMRKVGTGSLNLSNLVLGLRGDDAWDLHKINLAEAIDVDGDQLKELTDEYQEYVISPNLSLVEDDSVEYNLRGTETKSGTKVLDKILGFHLFAEGECSQVIEIEEVYLVKGSDKTTLDAFDREQKNKADAAVCWWRDSTGFIVQKGQDVSKAKYTIDLTNYEEENLVMNVMGDTTTATVGGVSWANLKDQNNEAVKPAVNGAYYSLVINLANSGITSSSVEVVSTKELCISKIFVSNLQDRDPVTVYPELDVANAAMFDNFNRTQSGFDGDYDASSTNPIVTDAGLYYALSYKNGDKITVADGHATFDATNLAADDYINFKEAAPAYTNQHYLVISVKAIEGATYDNFRFDVGNGVFYVNQMSSAFGLSLPRPDTADYPYTTADGYQWLIVDLKESGMEAKDYIDFYYSGTGKLLIDAVFYCDEVGRYPTYEETVIGEGESVTLVNYGYACGFTSQERLIKLTFTADEESTLETMRFEGADGLKWFKNGEVLDENGEAIDATQKLNGLTIIVDLEASGIGVGNAVHLHAGDPSVTAGSFSVTVKSMHPVARDNYEEIAIGQSDGTVTLVGYGYGCGFTSQDRLVKLTFTADEESTLETMRFEGADGLKWFRDSAVLDENGKAIDATQKLNGLTIIVDLEASGIGVGNAVHLHAGDPSVTAGSFSVTVKSLHEKAVDYAAIMSSLNQ